MPRESGFTKIEVPIGEIGKAPRPIPKRWIILISSVLLTAFTLWSVSATILIEALSQFLSVFLGGQNAFLAATSKNPIDLVLLLTVVPLCITLAHILTTKPRLLNLDNETRSKLITWLQTIQLGILLLGVLLQISMSLFSNENGISVADSLVESISNGYQESPLDGEVLMSFAFYWRAVLAVLTQDTIVYLIFASALCIAIAFAHRILRFSEEGRDLVEDDTKRRIEQRKDNIQRTLEEYDGRVAQLVKQIAKDELVRTRKISFYWKLHRVYIRSLMILFLFALTAWIPALCIGGLGVKPVVIALYFSFVGTLGVVAISKIRNSIDSRGFGMVIGFLVVVLQLVTVLLLWLFSSHVWWRIWSTFAIFSPYIFLLALNKWARRSRAAENSSRLPAGNHQKLSHEIDSDSGHNSNLRVTRIEVSTKAHPAEQTDNEEREVDSQKAEYSCFIHLQRELPETESKIKPLALNEIEATRSVYRTMESIASLKASSLGSNQRQRQDCIP